MDQNELDRIAEQYYAIQRAQIALYKSPADSMYGIAHTRASQLDLKAANSIGEQRHRLHRQAGTLLYWADRFEHGHLISPN